MLAEVLERVKRDYVDEVNDAELFEAAIRGMVADLDPHSAFLDAEEYQEIRISTTGNYSGVGLEVSMAEGRVVVVTPIDDTPAKRAGIAPGDVIVSIDHIPVDEKNLGSTVSRMRGKPGTSVNLDIEREAEPELLTFDLTRAHIKVVSVKSELLEPGYGYLRLTHFSETTTRDLHKAMEQLESDNGGALRGLVLDLRNNPGGVLDAAVEVSDAFLEQGLIVSAEGRVEEARFRMEARPGDALDGAEIIVLVNEGSASASEIVAGALQDHGRARIMGATTFGKGSVQTVMPLSSGEAIKLTTSRYFTPSGRSIHERGITPDVELDAPAVSANLEPEDPTLPVLQRDLQVREALNAMDGRQIRHSKVE